jgi:hypothetical protein
VRRQVWNGNESVGFSNGPLKTSYCSEWLSFLLTEIARRKSASFVHTEIYFWVLVPLFIRIQHLKICKEEVLLLPTLCIDELCVGIFLLSVATVKAAFRGGGVLLWYQNYVSSFDIHETNGSQTFSVCGPLGIFLLLPICTVDLE